MIRRATIDDLSQLLPLCEQFYQHFDYPFVAVRHRRLIERFLSNEHLGGFWLLMEDSSVVGYVALTNGFSFEFGGVDAFVDELFVAPSHRGAGLGSAALLALQKLAPSLGLVAIHLQTEHYNADARRLYQGLGFTDLRRSTQTWRVPDSTVRG